MELDDFWLQKWKGFIHLKLKDENKKEIPNLFQEEWKKANSKIYCAEIRLEKTKTDDIYSYNFLIHYEEEEYPFHFLKEIIKKNPFFCLTCIVENFFSFSKKKLLVIKENEFFYCNNQPYYFGPFIYFKKLNSSSNDSFYLHFFHSFTSFLMSLKLNSLNSFFSK